MMMLGRSTFSLMCLFFTSTFLMSTVYASSYKDTTTNIHRVIDSIRTAKDYASEGSSNFLPVLSEDAFQEIRQSDPNARQGTLNSVFRTTVKKLLDVHKYRSNQVVNATFNSSFLAVLDKVVENSCDWLVNTTQQPNFTCTAQELENLQRIIDFYDILHEMHYVLRNNTLSSSEYSYSPQNRCNWSELRVLNECQNLTSTHQQMKDELNTSLGCQPTLCTVVTQ